MKFNFQWTPLPLSFTVCGITVSRCTHASHPPNINTINFIRRILRWFFRFCLFPRRRAEYGAFAGVTLCVIRACVTHSHLHTPNLYIFLIDFSRSSSPCAPSPSLVVVTLTLWQRASLNFAPKNNAELPMSFIFHWILMAHLRIKWRTMTRPPPPPPSLYSFAQFIAGLFPI